MRITGPGRCSRALRHTLSALVVTGLYTVSANGEDGVWTSNGPVGVLGNTIATTAAAPDTVLLSASYALFRSTDGGTQWSQIGNGLDGTGVYDGALHPTDANRVYALTAARLYRSNDGGQMFTGIGTGLPSDGLLVQLRMGLTNPQHLYVVDNNRGVFRSTDGGQTFTASPLSPAPGANTTYRQLVQDPNAPQRVFLGVCDTSGPTASALYVSNDGGATFQAAVTGNAPTQCGAHDFAFSITTPGRVVATDGQRFYRSSDSGANWTLLVGPPFAPGRSSRMLAYRGDTLYGFGQRGLMTSSNHGDTWTAFGTGLIDNGVDATSVADLAFRPGAAGASEVHYVVAQAGSFFRSAVGGNAFAMHNSGLSGANIRAMAVHPGHPDRLFAGWGDVAGTTSPALFRSSDGGASWSRANTGLALDEVRVVTIDPTTAANPATTVIYAGGWDQAPIGRTPPQIQSSIARSIDGGATWTSLNDFTPAPQVRNMFGRVRSIVLDPTSGSGGGPLQTILFTATGRVLCPGTGTGPVPQVLNVARLWKSGNGGTSFTAIDNLPTGTCIPPGPTGSFPIPVPLVMHPTDPQTLYIGTYLSIPFRPGLPVPTIENGVFRSTDGGTTWSHRSTGLPRVDASTPGSSVRDVLALAIDPVDPQTLFAATNPTGDGQPGRVYKSTDAGATWTLSSTGIAGQDIRSLLVDRSVPGEVRVFAASGGTPSGPGGIFLSRDGGVSWNSLSINLPADSGTALALDTSGSQPVLHAGTRNGAFRQVLALDGDGDGAPTPTETSAPAGGDGDGDGIPDNLQAGTASILGAGATRGASAAITIRVVPVQGNCAQINDAHALASDSVGIADAGFRQPQGVIRMELQDCQRARLIVRFHGSSFQNGDSWRAFGPLLSGNPATLGWTGIANATVAGNAWTFEFADQDPGDHRGELNRILLVAGPARSNDPVFGNGFE